MTLEPKYCEWCSVLFFRPKCGCFTRAACQCSRVCKPCRDDWVRAQSDSAELHEQAMKETQAQDRRSGRPKQVSVVVVQMEFSFCQ